MSFPPATEAKKLTPQDAAAKQRAGVPLLDLREAHETVLGAAQGAILLPWSTWAERTPPGDFPQGAMLICATGRRSERAAIALSTLTAGPWYCVQGGFSAWRSAQLPWQRDPQLQDAEYARYSRQLILPGFGLAGQLQLKRARVLLVGAGGLGSPALLYLAAAGVGKITVADGDRVELSNLHRQVAHSSLTLGEWKAHSAGFMATALNPEVQVDTLIEPVTATNAQTLVAEHDIVVDGSDNFATRYLLNEACVRQQKPLVYGAVHRFEGQISLFAPHLGGPCYRCLHPEAPSAAEAPNCAEAGVLGVVPGLMGLLQATEAIKHLTGLGKTLFGRLLLVDCANMHFRELKLARDPECMSCGSRADSARPLEIEQSGLCPYTEPRPIAAEPR